MGSIKIEGRWHSDMAGGNECQSWILLQTRIRRFGDSWSLQPSTKKSSPKKASLLIDMQYLGLLLFGDVDVGLAMGSIKIEVRWHSDMAGGNECQSWILLQTRIRQFGDSWSLQPSPKKSSSKISVLNKKKPKTVLLPTQSKATLNRKAFLCSKQSEKK